MRPSKKNAMAMTAILSRLKSRFEAVFVVTSVASLDVSTGYKQQETC